MWGFTSSYIDYPEPGVGLPYPHPLVSGAAPVATPTPRSSEIIYYRPEKHKRVKMLPTQKLVERITLDTGLTAEQIAALNEGRDKARLFVYNRGKYTDEQGTSYDFTSCHEYDVVSFPRLIRCDDSVTIKDLP